MTLADSKKNQWVTVSSVRGERGFRRRLLEVGFVEGTPVRVIGVAPLGDPIELELRGGRMSLRASEASIIDVSDT
jgi:ferrous iron transport protein A